MVRPWSLDYPAPRVLTARSLPSRQDAGGFPPGDDDWLRAQDLKVLRVKNGNENDIELLKKNKIN